MTLGKLREMTAHLPDETELWYEDMNFGGREKPFDEDHIYLPTNDIYPEILISSMVWTEVE